MKKHLSLFVILIVLSCGSKANNDDHFFKLLKKGTTTNIRFINNHTDNWGAYSFYKEVQSFSNEDKLKMIEELLGYEGNMKPASFIISCSNKNLSQFYTGDVKSYSVQIGALLLINQIYFKNPYYYSPYPIIIDKVTKTEINNSQEQISEVFSKYNDWLKIVKEKGLNHSRSQGILPLDKSSQYSWIYGINIPPNDELQFELTELNDVFEKIKKESNKED